MSDLPPVQPPVGEFDPDKSARTWAIACHLGGLGILAWIPGINLALPLIFWLLKREDHPWIDANGKEAVNFHISISIYLAVAYMLIPVLVGVLFAPLVWIFGLICTVIGAIKCSNRQLYRYPLTIRLVQ